MKKILLTTILFSAINFLFADIPAGYYDSADGLSGEDLKSTLHNIIDGHTVKSYSDLWTILKETDEDPNNSDNFILLYTRRSIPKTSAYPDFNREHVWAKSHGFPDESDYGYTDAHHLRPSDVEVNSARGNLDFDNGGTLVSETSDCYKDADSFEPGDEIKGDVARMMFYMTVRYEGDGNSSDDYDLELVDYVGTSGVNLGKLSTLLEWHYADPVDDIERHRNEVVYSYQNNRNPFIDHPEYVAQIWGGSGNMLPSITDITISPLNPTSSDNVSVSATITDSVGNISSAELHWGLSSGSLTKNISLTNSSGDTYTTSSSIPLQADGTTIFFEIEATDNEPETNTSSEQNYTVSDNPSIVIIDEDFSSCPASGWITFSITGSEDWSCVSGYMEINAYGSDIACNDWIISPAIDLDSYTDEVLTFSSWTRYSDSYYPPVELKYSTDYSGSGDPSGSTWSNISASWSGEDSQTWTNSGDVDLSSITGSEVYIAINYTSSGTGAGTSAQWEIDDFIVTGEIAVSGNNPPVISDISVTPSTPLEEDEVTVLAIITDSDGSISSANVKWGTSSGSYPNTISMSNSGDDYSATIPSQPAGATIFLIIEATDNESDSEQSAENSYTVNNKPVISSVAISPESPTENDDVIVSATIMDSDGSISSANVKWGTSSGSYPNTVSMSNSGDNYSGTIPSQPAGTTIFLIIEATDNESDSEQTSENSYTVNNKPVISSVAISPESPTENDDVTVSATIMDSDGSISSANVKWGTSSGSYPNTISMSNSGDDYSATIPSQSGGTNVYYLIEATDNNAKAETFYSYYEVSESSGIKQFAYNNLKIYPNPATDIINIVFSDGSKTETIKLFNLIGEKVLEASDINSSEVSVNLNQFAKGIYFLQIDNGYNRIVKKVMLE